MSLLLVLVAITTACGPTTTTSGLPTETTTRRLAGIQRATPMAIGMMELSDARTGESFRVAPDSGLRLVYFGYTSCPDVCPTTLSDLRRALATTGPPAEKVSLTFVTVDPERDTPQVLDQYIGSFVTQYDIVRITDPATLAKVEEPFGAQSHISEKKQDGTYEVSHTGTLYAVDPSGQVVIEWPFGTPSEAIAGDLAQLLAEEGRTATGSSVDVTQKTGSKQ